MKSENKQEEENNTLYIEDINNFKATLGNK